MFKAHVAIRRPTVSEKHKKVFKNENNQPMKQKTKNDIRNLVYITHSTKIVWKLQQRPVFVNILGNPLGNPRKKDEDLQGP